LCVAQRKFAMPQTLLYRNPEPYDPADFVVRRYLHQRKRYPTKTP
jgi:hypothetical protein